MWTKYIKLERQILDQEKGLVDIHKGSARSYLELSRSYIGATFFQWIGCWLCSLSYLLPVGLMLSVFCGSTSFRGRRKRSIKIDGVPLADVKPSQLNQEVQSSQDAKLDREGRFLLYWITTTSISTSTSFTTTISISG